MLYATAVKAQTTLKFDQRLIDCENKWIVAATDSSYAFGFVYLDNSAGLTLNVAGTFTQDGQRLIPKRIDPAKVRISSTAVKVALLPSLWFKELEITENPSWLSFYKTSDEDINRLFRLGSTYNQWNDPTTALKYLNAVRKKNSKYPGLDIEFSRAFIEQKKYQRAEAYTTDAIYRVQDEKNNCNLYSNQVFSLTGGNKMDNAEEIYRHALCECKEEVTKAEMAYNIAFQYFKLKNKEKLQYWRKEVDRWIVPISYTEKIDLMLKQLQ